MRIALAAFLLGWAILVRASDRALLIGVDENKSAPPLYGAVNDALLMAKTLHENGFKVELLLDTGATRAKILDRIQKLLAAAGPNDHVVISFSGRGSPNRHGWLAYDGDYVRETNLVLPQDVTKLLMASKAGFVTLVLDH